MGTGKSAHAREQFEADASKAMGLELAVELNIDGQTSLAPEARIAICNIPLSERVSSIVPMRRKEASCHSCRQAHACHAEYRYAGCDKAIWCCCAVAAQNRLVWRAECSITTQLRSDTRS